MTVRPHQHELALVKGGDGRLGDGDEGQRDFALLPGIDEGRRLACIRAEAKEREAFAEQIERGTPVGEPCMRRAMSGPRRLNVDARIVGGRGRAIRPADR